MYDPRSLTRPAHHSSLPQKPLAVGSEGGNLSSHQDYRNYPQAPMGAGV